MSENKKTKIKSGIGGSLLLPLIILFLFPTALLGELTKFNTIHFPFKAVLDYIGLALDLFVVVIAIILIISFFQKKSRVPGMYIMFLLFLPIFWGADFLFRQSDSGMPLVFAVLFCLILVPFLSLSRRTKATFFPDFINILTPERDSMEKLNIFGKVYCFFHKYRKMVIPFTFLYIIFILAILCGISVFFLDIPLI